MRHNRIDAPGMAALTAGSICFCGAAMAMMRRTDCGVMKGLAASAV